MVLHAHRLGVEDPTEGVQCVNRREQPQFGDGATQRDGRPEVGEGGLDGRVGEVVGGHVDRLHRRDRAPMGRGDPLLEIPHLCRQGGLVSHRGGHPAQQRRDLTAGHHVAEHVVDEEQDIRPLLVAELLGHGQARQGDPESRSRGLVHLAEDQGGLVDHPRFMHLPEERVAFPGTLPHPGEHRVARVLLGDVADEFHDDDGLAHPGASEEPDLRALGEGADEVDHLEAGLQDLGRGLLL